MPMTVRAKLVMGIIRAITGFFVLCRLGSSPRQEHFSIEQLSPAHFQVRRSQPGSQ
jgi:hypothetical protein